MKILIVADAVTDSLLKLEHGRPVLDGIDLILSCGDLPPEYLTGLRARFDTPLYYILGNHDIRYESSPPVGCRLIDRRLMVFEGIRILGLSGSRWYNGNINQYTEREMAYHIRKMWFQLWRSKGVDLVVTHAPPRYVNDAEDNCHKGFHAFRKLINRYAPTYLLHGHIHRLFADDAERFNALGTTKVINCYGYYVLEI